ncbi:MAG: hypothetical protein WBN44_08830 [Woeseiaceae bacterium]
MSRVRIARVRPNSNRDVGCEPIMSCAPFVADKLYGIKVPMPVDAQAVNGK